MPTGSPLGPYRDKRDFGATPEPAGAEAASAGAADAPRFVIQEHHATALHWDLRLERDGALASWALPRGLPQHPDRNHLAVRTEDHPLEYLEFHGEIPAGSYGAGTMAIWDRGTFETHKWREREVMVTLYGERARGRYVLFPTDGKNWMIHRMDPPLDPDRLRMPDALAPMLEVAKAKRFEGIIAKKLGSPYRPGRRSSEWIKIKLVKRTSLVIGGWLGGDGGRTGRLGALCVGFHEDGVLRYAGRVGTGFTDAELDRLMGLLRPLATDDSPFGGRQPPRAAHFVTPSLVCEVEYLEWTQTRTLRAPSYKGLRDDLDPAAIPFEDAP